MYKRQVGQIESLHKRNERNGTGKSSKIGRAWTQRIFETNVEHILEEVRWIISCLLYTSAIAYSELYGKEIRYCSDRKEEKDHGADKGSFLGSSLKDGDRVVMLSLIHI